jgi:soluble cytochrome b562
MNRLFFAAFLIAATMSIATAAEPYVPGMGEIMGATQMRHSKLWFAGKAGNWPLANYELGEIREGLDDAILYHPVFKESVPVAKILDRFTASPLKALEKAIKDKNETDFRKAFDSLTNACNGCHQAADRGYISITVPTVSPYTNQDFSVKK